MLRTVLISAGMTVAGWVGALVPAQAATFLAAQPPATAGAPYSAQVVTASTTAFSDGNRIVRSKTVRCYRDSQGRTRVERPTGSVAQTDSGTDGDVLITINDPVSGQHIVLNPERKIASVIKTRSGAASPQPAMDADMPEPFALMGLGMSIGAGRFTESSSNTVSLGQKTINGLTATGTRVVRTIPSGVLGNKQPITSTVEEWVSPDLGVSVQVTATSSLGGQVSLNLQNVDRSEPDPSLFKVPAGYTQRAIGLSAAMTAVSTTENVTAVKTP
jgi:hypothetical protein